MCQEDRASPYDYGFLHWILEKFSVNITIRQFNILKKLKRTESNFHSYVNYVDS